MVSNLTICEEQVTEHTARAPWFTLETHSILWAKGKRKGAALSGLL